MRSLISLISCLKLSLLLKGLTKYLSITSMAVCAAYLILVTTVDAACLSLVRVPPTADFDLVSDEYRLEVEFLMDSLYS